MLSIEPIGTIRISIGPVRGTSSSERLGIILIATRILFMAGRRLPKNKADQSERAYLLESGQTLPRRFASS